MKVYKNAMVCYAGTKRARYSTTGFLLFMCQSSGICLPSSSPDYSQQAQVAQSDLTPLDCSQFMRSGLNMTKKEAERLEKSLLVTPDSFASHIKLLGYYSSLSSIEASQEKTKHIVWIIRHHPASEMAGTPSCLLSRILDPEGAEAGTKAWQEQIAKNPLSAAVLGNAGFYFITVRDDNAIDVLTRAHLLEPQNPKWLIITGEYYESKIHEPRRGKIPNEERTNANRLYALKAFDIFNRALLLTKGIGERTLILNELTPLAYKAGKFDDAQNDGTLLLNMARQHPNASLAGSSIFTGHTTLGKLELRKGHIEEAKQHLLGSTNISKDISEVLLPDMSLARELLKANQRTVVIEFLTRCKSFCKRTELDDWISEIERGLTPDFDKL